MKHILQLLTRALGQNVGRGGGGSPWQRAAQPVLAWGSELRGHNNGVQTPQRLLAASLLPGWANSGSNQKFWREYRHQIKGADALRGMVPATSIAGARNRERLCQRPQLELLLPGCAALTSAWVTEVTPEDQVLCVQEFLQQPRKSTISLTNLTGRSVTDTKPKLPLGDDPTSPDPKALNRLLVVSAHLCTFKFFCYLKCSITSSSSLPVLTKECVAIRCGLPVS